MAGVTSITSQAIGMVKVQAQRKVRHTFAVPGVVLPKRGSSALILLLNTIPSTRSSSGFMNLRFWKARGMAIVGSVPPVSHSRNTSMITARLLGRGNRSRFVVLDKKTNTTMISHVNLSKNFAKMF
ncbi:uncharacterized protein LOC112347677 [Selaginella moellendorffii]|uniref:uncharacterized protein LOC112347677 n=1 Tax=Selaginella moellendorffii TaxID=88036 RepID=UPI000D1C5EFC|nr:uncharacterized protein LOC112347677 [Selaginella moellendorffii]|eukprot:XP_024534734.1 uncharacterized protein LOC112347677 [Selaginella moellendorffii]